MATEASLEKPPNPSWDEKRIFFAAIQEEKEADIRHFLNKYPHTLDEKNAQGVTALGLAAWSGHERTVVMLLEMGAAPDEKSFNGMTPPMWAHRGGHPSIVKLLLDWPKIKKERLEAEHQAELSDFSPKLKRPMRVPRKLVHRQRSL